MEDQHILLRPHDSQNSRDPGEAPAREWPWTNNLNSKKKTHNPEQWLRENSYPELFDDGASRGGSNGRSTQRGLPGNTNGRKRPRAAIISLVRNEELDGILQSMAQLELHWNRVFQYPWIFFNEMPFSEEFKVSATNRWVMSLIVLA